MAEVYASVAPSGGDYTSLEACEAGEQQDYVGGGNNGVWEITGDWSAGGGAGPDTNSMVVDGSTTNTTGNGIEIRADASNDPSGTWSTSKYILLGDAAAAVLRIADAGVTVRGLQIELNATATSGLLGTSGQFFATGVLVDGSAASSPCFGVTSSSTAILHVKNSASSGGSVGVNRGTNGSVVAHHFTAYGATTGFSANVTVNNCLAQSCTTGYAATVGDYNCDDDGSAPGANSFTDTASFVNAAAFDLHLSAALSAQGDDLSADATLPVTDDWDGDARSNWDVGADEIAAAPPAASVPRRALMGVGF